MHKNCHRWSITPAVLVILCVLTAVVVSGTGAASASARIDTSEAASDIQPDDVASTFEIASAQALRDRVPATLFPAVTATLQSTGTSDMYEAIPGLSGERAYRLENPPHSMSAEFDTLGVSISSGNEGKWTWSLRFDGYARGHVGRPRRRGQAHRRSAIASSTGIPAASPSGTSTGRLDSSRDSRSRAGSCRRSTARWRCGWRCPAT